jgi:hypothetical protein
MGFNLENYETVEDRLARFWADHPNGRIHTSIHHYDDNKIVVRAEAYFDRDKDTHPVATGYAEEVRGASPVNKTSHVENAETSAIGRSLANCNYAPRGARPSREEMAKVQRAAQPVAAVKTDNVSRFKEACVKAGLKAEDVAVKAGVEFDKITDADLPKLRDAFKQMQTPQPEAVTVEQKEKAVAAAFPGAKVVETGVPTARLKALMNARGFKGKDAQTELMTDHAKRAVADAKDLTKQETLDLIEILNG